MSTQPEAKVISGLEGVLACGSSVCFIDGPNGVLLYRGYAIGDFVEEAEFLDVVWLLWHGDWPDTAQSQAFAAEVAAQRALPAPVVGFIAGAPIATANPMSILRTAVSMLGVTDPDADDISTESVLSKATGLVARLPTVVAAMSRLVRGDDPVAPDPGLGHAANFLYMLTGEPPSGSAASALNAVLNTYAEHELNASTFTARTTVGTLSDYYSAITSAAGALKGALHGGAVDDAMGAFREIGVAENVTGFLDAALAARRKVPGFGHRVYRTRDPRCAAMDRLAGELGEAAGEPDWHAVATGLERELLERKGLSANVDYYSALVLYHLGFPLNMFTSFIAASRIAGWTAHLLEQYADNRLIRPRALYEGETARPYPPG